MSDTGEWSLPATVRLELAWEKWLKAGSVTGAEPRLTDALGGAEPEEFGSLLEVERRFLSENGRRSDLMAMVDRYPEYARDICKQFGVPAPGDVLGPGAVKSSVPGFRYHLRRLVGRGAQGVVYEAEQEPQLVPKTIALKVLSPGALGARAGTRLANEVTLSGLVEHVGKVNVFDYHLDGRLQYFAMTYVAGGRTVEALIPRDGRRPDVRRAVAVIADAASVMADLHARLVHCDLKPGNLLIDGSGHVRVADFGLARLLETPGRRPNADLPAEGGWQAWHETAVAGTPEYMAPEVAEGVPPEPSADVFSLGATLYHLVTGQTLYLVDRDGGRDQVRRAVAEYRIKDPAILYRRVGSNLGAIIMDSLNEERRHRPSARELAERLRAYLGRRRRWAFALAGGGLMLGLGLAYVGVADAGVRIWGGGALRRSIDRHAHSLFRRAKSTEEIEQAAARSRHEILGRFRGLLRDDGWLPQTFPDPSRPRDSASDATEAWTQAQPLASIFAVPDGTAPDLRQFVLSLDKPFHPDCAEYVGLPYGWKAIKADNNAHAVPALWIATGLANALGRPGLIKGDDRIRLKGRLTEVQNILEKYRRADEPGAWNMFPPEAAQPGNVYCSALALLMLLEVHRADLPWDGSSRKCEKMIGEAAVWLAGQFDAGASPPGWPNRHGAAPGASIDGLNLLVDTVLLRAEVEAGVRLPEPLAEAILRHLGRCLDKDWNSENGGTEYRTAAFEASKGVWGQGRQYIQFPWHAWGIACARAWQRRSEVHAALPEDVVQVRRVLGHLVVDLGKQLHDRVAPPGGMTWIAAETLYGLNAVAPPARPRVPDGAIEPNQVRRHTGRRVVVEMVVRSSKYSPEHDVFYLDSRGDYTMPDNLAIVIPNGVAPAFRAAYHADPPAIYDGRRIRIRGEVSIDEAQKQVQIRVTAPDQIEILSED